MRSAQLRSGRAAQRRGTTPRLSLTDHKYLDLINREGPLTAGRLAELTSLTSGAVMTLVDRLTAAKLTTRTADDTDRRRVLIAARGSRLAEIGTAMGALGERMRCGTALQQRAQLHRGALRVDAGCRQADPHSTGESGLSVLRPTLT